MKEELKTQKKFFKVSELINDYIDLQREFQQYKIDNLKSTIWLLETLLRPSERKEDIRGIEVNKLIEGLKYELENERKTIQM